MNGVATPRPARRVQDRHLQEGVEKITDLKPGMQREGVVTNVAAFGAFVDVGVHQDGLVHVSELSDRFVKDPHEVVKAGDVVKARVKEVDVARKRIALTMRSGAIERNAMAGAGRPAGQSAGPRTSAPSPKATPPAESAFAAALRRAQERR
jgi:protein Tex